MKFLSKKQLDEQKPDYALLPQDDYKLEIVKIEEAVQNKFEAKPDENGNIPQEPIVNITLQVISFKDGSEAYDEKGLSATGRKIFFTARPESMGFAQSGEASKSRTLVAYATGQDIFGELELDNWQDLYGRKVFATIIKKLNPKGELKNRISKFVPERKQRPIAQIKDEDIPIIEDDVDAVNANL